MKPSIVLRRWQLPLLLLIALLLRLQGWYPFQVVDEGAILDMVWGLHLNPFPPGMPPPLPGYPPLFMYLNFFLSLLYENLLVFLGVFASAGEFLASPLAQTFTYKAGQLLVAFLGTWHIAIVWKIGREFFDRRVAWLAALIVAFHPHLIFNGHIFKSDLPLALFFALLLLYALRFLRNLETKDFLAVCFITGLTTACKFNGAVEVLLIPIILWAVRKKLAPKRCWQLLFVSPLFGLFGFLVGAPNWLVHPIKSFHFAFQYIFFNFREYIFYEKVSSTYGLYAVDLWRTLGPIFVFLFFLGILFTFLRRKREEMIIVFSIFLYFLVLGGSGYYSSRVILPLYGGVALLIAKAAFQDICPLLKKPFLRLAFTITVFSAASLLSLGNIRDSVSQFNLWKSTSTWEEALNFRSEHIPSTISFGREMFTPIKPGDFGRWDISDIPYDFFHGPKALPFINTGLLTDFVLKRIRSGEIKENFRARLQEYRLFHRISKPRFSQWEGDILFWYHPNPRILAYRPGRKSVFLPRLFRRQAGSTLFYPLQPYEKDPGFFSLEGPFWGKWILSSRPLGTISVTLFSPEEEIEAKVKINSRQIVLKASRGSAESVFSAPPPLSFQKSPTYRIEATLPKEHLAAFLLVQEIPPVPPQETLHLASPLEGDPPPPFSSEMLPGWVREFYRRTGLDLSLLSMTQEVVVWENTERSLMPFTSEWTVLSRGVYRWEMETEPLLSKVHANAPTPFEIVCFRGHRLETQTLTWQKVNDGHYAASFENSEEKFFLRVKTGDFQKLNLLLRRLILRPDYLRSLRQGMVLRVPSE